MINLRISQHFISPKINPAKPPNLGQSRCRLHRADHRMCRGRGVRVSAPLGRGAAPYADGSLSSQTPSHLISLSILGVPEEFSPEFYIEF